MSGTATTTTPGASKAENLSFVLEAQDKFKFEDRPVPKLSGPKHVLVEVAWTGICGSDVHYWAHGQLGEYVVREPLVLGHESSGTVVEVGAGVTTLRPGDRVALEPGAPCYHCRLCKSGSYNLCADMVFAGTPPVHGTFSRFYALPADLCHAIPDHVSLETAALAEPTAVAVHAARLAGIGPPARVVVFGAGPVGLLCAGVARAFGASAVAVVDIQEKRLDFARSWVPGGCVTFIPARNASAADNAARLLEQLGCPEGADMVIEASGATPCIQQGMYAVRRGGTYVQVGMGADNVEIPLTRASQRETVVRGCFRYSEGDYGIALDLISRGVPDVSKLISKRYVFEDAEQAFKDTKAGLGIKMLIEGVKV